LFPATLLLAVLVAGFGCSSSTDVAARCDNGAVIPVHVASATTTPVFSWASSCSGLSFKVTYADNLGNPITVWGLSNSSLQNSISSPVTYGQSLPVAKPLMAGTTYTVTILGWDAASGQTRFTGIGQFVH
jgi:hypothetical protein